MKKIILFLLVASTCFAQYNPQFNRQPEVGYQINLAHPYSQGLVRFFIFNEGLGNTLFNLAPNGNDGTLTAMDAETDWVAGLNGWALDFDGIDDDITIPFSQS